MTLPAVVQDTIDTLALHGFEAFAVGGAVRDFFLGKDPGDWDIATSALPENVIDIFGKKNCIPTGIKHGTVTLVTNKQMIEITTYRIDGEYRDNRHPECVTFSKNICDDLSRRDFTINAMAYNPKLGICDPFGGKEDLEKGIICTVGDPVKRFSEDGLRIIRGLRFSAVLGFCIEEHTKTAIYQCKHLLGNIAIERLRTELVKIIMSNNPGPVLIEFSDVFAEFLCSNKDFCQETWVQNASRLSSCPQDPDVRLALLLDGISATTPSWEILRSLKCDNKTIFQVKTISNYLYKDLKPDRIFIKHILSDIGEKAFKAVLYTKKAKYPQDVSTLNNTEELLNEIISSNQCFRLKDLMVDGLDLMELGISGTETGRILKLLLNAVIEEQCKNEKPALVELARKLK